MKKTNQNHFRNLRCNTFEYLSTNLNILRKLCNSPPANVFLNTMTDLSVLFSSQKFNIGEFNRNFYNKINRAIQDQSNLYTVICVSHEYINVSQFYLSGILLKKREKI